MSLVRVHNFSVSLDGFGTGEGQQLDAPFGHAGTRLLEWAFETRTFRAMGIHGESEGSFGVDEAFASRTGNNNQVQRQGEQGQSVTPRLLRPRYVLLLTIHPESIY